MANGRSKGIGIAVLIGLGLLAFAGTASADDDDDDDDDDDAPPDCPLGQVPQLQADGTWLCVPIVVVDPPVFPGDDDPLPDLPNVCNYSGCGAPFDNTHQHPSVYAQRIQQLGYPINFAAIAGNGTLIAVSPARDYVRAFQRDFNAVRASQGLNAPAAIAGATATNALAAIKSTAKLSEDGLNGNNTIAATPRAQALVNALGISWEQIVNLAGG